MKFYKSSSFWTLILFFVLAAVFHLASPNIPDPDSFYHLAHAKIYRAEGLTFSEFPWTQYSATRTQSSDIWYGFHVLLIPFSIFDGTLGIKLSGMLLTLLALAGLWLVFKKLNLKWPAFWPLFIFFSAPNIMNRFLMARPHLLSLTLAALLFYFFVTAKNQFAAKPKRITSMRSYACDTKTFIFISSLLLVWTHISLAWIPLLIFGVVFLIKGLTKKTWLWQEGLVLLFGSVIGWLARPNPWGSLKLAYIQVVQLMLEKQKDYSLLFGRELFPLAPQTLFQNFSAFMLVWLAAMGLLIYLRQNFKNQPSRFKTVVWSGLILSLIFFFLTILTARRAHDFWIPFGTIFIAASYTTLTQHPYMLKNVRVFMVTALILISAFLSVYTPWRNMISLEERAVPPNKFKEAAIWLKENSQTGDIVFNTRWSDFPMLFFWNQKNYYIGGMDPIFQYAYDPALYWRFHYLSADEVTKYTCPAPACTKDMLEETYSVLKNNFKAKYVFLEKQRNPLVYYYLESTPEHYEKKLDTKSEAIYLIK